MLLFVSFFPLKGLASCLYTNLGENPTFPNDSEYHFRTPLPGLFLNLEFFSILNLPFTLYLLTITSDK